MGVLVLAPTVAHTSAAAAAPVVSAPAETATESISPRLAAIVSATPSTAGFLTQAQAAGLPTSGPGSLIHDASGRVLVDVTVDPGTELTGATMLGAELVAVAPDGRMATVATPTFAIPALATLPGVRYVAEVLAPVTAGRPAPADLDRPVPASSGCGTGVTTEGDAQLNADDVRAAHGVDGTGVRVGIVSDSFDALAGAAPDIAAGELPGIGNPCGRTTPVDVVAEFPGETDEGRAMAQIVHDLAPGASLSFATAYEGELAMANRIRQLADEGADIVTDDIAYLYAPMYQDGYVAAAINENLAEHGVRHFTSAGNSNLVVGGEDVASYEAPAFRATSCPASAPVTWMCHDFDPGAGVDGGNNLTLANGGTLSIALGWNEPQFGVMTDLALAVVDTATGDIVATADINNFLYGRPNEYLTYANTSGAAQSLDLVVARDGEGLEPRFKYIHMRSSGITAVERDTSAGGDVIGPSITGHSAAADAVVVGAVPYHDATTPEPFSSKGPATICWEPVDGSVAQPAIDPCEITGVDLVATDGGATSFFGSNVGGTWRFYGTSAAAPHAAAVAALTMSYATCATADEVVAAMLAGAAPVGSSGSDAVGAGLVDATATIAALATTSPRPCVTAPGAPPTVSAGETTDIALSVTDFDDGPAAVTLTVSSDDEELVPQGGLVVSGAGADRTLVVAPNADVTGDVTITVVARDPDGIESALELDVEVVPAPDEPSDEPTGEPSEPGDDPTEPPAAPADDPLPVVTTVTPSRLADTRDGATTDDGRFAADGPIAGGTTYRIAIAGRGGIPSNATAAVVNLSTVDSAGNGFLTVYDCGDRPLASSINYTAGGAVNNEVMARLSADGDICVYAKTTTDLVVDAVGATDPSSPFVPIVPARLADTRADGATYDGRFAGDGAIAGGTVHEVEIRGRGGVDDDATAAVLNLSTVDSAGNGFLTIYDCGDRPLASSINYAAGAVVNNEIIAKLSDDGRICIYARTTTHLVIDAVGSVPSGDGYRPMRPARLVDTRATGSTVDTAFAGDGAIVGDTTYEVDIAGRAGIPSDASAVVLNLSTVDSAGNGFLTIFDCGARPLASGINYAAGAVVNNEIIAKLSDDGRICIYARTTTHVVVDAVGSL